MLFPIIQILKCELIRINFSNFVDLVISTYIPTCIPQFNINVAGIFLSDYFCEKYVYSNRKVLI